MAQGKDFKRDIDPTSEKDADGDERSSYQIKHETTVVTPRNPTYQFLSNILKLLILQTQTLLTTNTVGDTEEETRRNFQAALAEHFEVMRTVGEPTPEPHTSVDYVEVVSLAFNAGHTGRAYN